VSEIEAELNAGNYAVALTITEPHLAATLFKQWIRFVPPPARYLQVYSFVSIALVCVCRVSCVYRVCRVCACEWLSVVGRGSWVVCVTVVSYAHGAYAVYVVAL
jgi:hypothetical protein